MSIYIASDHRGFELKEFLKLHISNLTDVGPFSLDPDDDYVDYAQKACDPTTWQSNDLGILICGSGHGMDITANRHSYIRAILGFNSQVVQQGREHENANVLVVPSDWTTNDQAIILVDLFLNTSFSNQSRHLRRLQKLSTI